MMNPISFFVEVDLLKKQYLFCMTTDVLIDFFAKKVHALIFWCKITYNLTVISHAKRCRYLHLSGVQDKNIIVLQLL